MDSYSGSITINTLGDVFALVKNNKLYMDKIQYMTRVSDGIVTEPFEITTIDKGQTVPNTNEDTICTIMEKYLRTGFDKDNGLFLKKFSGTIYAKVINKAPYPDKREFRSSLSSKNRKIIDDWRKKEPIFRLTFKKGVLVSREVMKEEN